MNRVVRTAALAAAAVCLALLTGCTGSRTSVDELLRAPRLGGEYNAV